jgi:hypothetical protein
VTAFGRAPLSWVAVSLAAVCGCEKVSHENIDRWENTEKGAGKLRDALTGDHSDELRAHAAQVLIRTGELDYVLEVLDAEEKGERAAIMPLLVERLARDAALESELSRPQPHHVAAKDALFELRDRAPPEVRSSIESTLIAWLTGGYYEGRSKSGRTSGRRIVRAIGDAAGPALVAAARRVLDRPPDAEGRRARLGDELLGSLALSGHPGAIGLLLDLVEKPQLDPSLSRRALDALEVAYIRPKGIERASGEALEPIAGRIAALAGDAEQPARVADVAIALLAAIGPACRQHFVDLVSHPHPNESFRWAALQNGVRCGGVEAVVPLVNALPERAEYSRVKLDKYLWREIMALPEKRAVAARARELLGAESWVGRVTGVELLGKLQLRGQTEADADLVSRLAGDTARLRGWYPKNEQKTDPRLGQVASQVARELTEVAQPPKSK